MQPASEFKVHNFNKIRTLHCTFTEPAGDMRSTEETTEIKLGSNVRHRRSKAWRSVDVEEKESHDLHDTWWFMRWSAYIGRSLGHGLDDLAYGVSTIVLSPAALVLGRLCNSFLYKSINQVF